MYQAANRWMKKPTPVITPSIVSDNASSDSVNVGAKSPICIHVHNGCVNVPPLGGLVRN